MLMSRAVVFAVTAIGLLVAGCDRQASKATATVESGGSLAKVVGGRRIVAGWAPYAPYASKDLESGKPVGYYIELFEQMAGEAQLKVTWVETTWSTMVSDLKAGRFEVMAAPTFRTIPRAMEVSFTRSIDYFGLSAIVRQGDTRFHVPDDFDRDDITVAVTLGEVGHEFAKRHLPRVKLNEHKAGDISLALTDVIQGRADVGLCDSWTARLFAQEHKDVVTDLFADKPFNQVGAGWFVSIGDTELLQFLDTAIDWLESSGELDRIARKYGVDVKK